jgi:hypothetical protein
VLNVRVAAHYEFSWEGRPNPRTVRLYGPREEEDAHVS